jgi:hypothetical protein
LSVFGADPIAEVKLFSILHFTITVGFQAPVISLGLAENFSQEKTKLSKIKFFL